MATCRFGDGEKVLGDDMMPWKKGQVAWNKGRKSSPEHCAAIKAGMNNEMVKNKIRQSRKRFIEDVLPTMTAEERKIWGQPGKANPMFGKRHSEETKQEMGRNRSGGVGWWKGRKRSPEQCKQISRASKQWWRKIGSKMSAEERKIWGTPGADHPNWKGGKSFHPYPLEWTVTFREQIRYRDGYCCQICGKTETDNGRRLEVHHIDYDKHNLQLTNLITLCMICHRSAGGNRKYWQSYFTEGNDAQNTACVV